MSLNQSLLSELDQEMASTRKALERVPTEKFGWKPHEKSGTMGWLANHIATIPQWATTTLQTETFNADGVAPPPQAANTADLLALFDNCVAEFKQTLGNASDDSLKQIWSMIYGGQKIMEMPRIAVLRGMILNHLIHPRGQLTVYLRLNDIPVPELYGPSADEGSFGASA
jgi:uncharacterized damage-inducible protein DinB